MAKRREKNNEICHASRASSCVGFFHFFRFFFLRSSNRFVFVTLPPLHRWGVQDLLAHRYTYYISSHAYTYVRGRFVVVVAVSRNEEHVFHTICYANRRAAVVSTYKYARVTPVALLPDDGVIPKMKITINSLLAACFSASLYIRGS